MAAAAPRRRSSRKRRAPRSRRLRLSSSLRVKLERERLSAIAEAVGVELVFLKAAWADPVLYGARGERTGFDVDVLLADAELPIFASALLKQGYRHRREKRPRRFLPPPKAEVFFCADGLSLDVHRALGDWPFFSLPGRDLCARAIPWDSPDGPIRGLCPEDQVLHAAAHSASQALDLAEQHFQDIAQLLARFPVRWQTILRRARTAHLRLPLAHLGRWLDRHGTPTPARITRLSRLEEVRLRLALRLALARWGGRRWWMLRVLLALGLLSDAPLALPRYLGAELADRLWLSLAGLRAGDVLR